MNTEISSKTIEFRKKLNGKKVYFKDILPNNQMRKALLSTHTSTDVDLSKFSNKLYIDPIFAEEMPRAVVAYAVLNGDWLIDEEIDEYGTPIVKFTDNKSGQYFKLGFPDQINKLRLLNETQTSQPIKQENSGMNISDVVNNNALYEKKSGLSKVKVATAITAVVASVGLLAFFRRGKNR